MTTMADALRALYAADPAQFVATRKTLAAQARGEGERALATEIMALRKPTVAAAAVNRLDDEALEGVLALGRELRAAQTRLDSAAMKELTTRRQRLLHEVVTQTGLSGATAEEVRSTLLAATADLAAADAVASRALVKAVHYSGWGDVDLGDAVAHQAMSDAGRPALRVVEGGAATTTTESTMTTASPTTKGTPPSTESEPSAAAEDAPAAPHLRERQRQEAEREVDRLRTRLRAAQTAVDAATAARDSSQAALDAALAHLATLQ